MRMRRLPVGIGIALLLAGCRTESAPSPLQPPRPHPAISPSAAPLPSATPQSWTLPNGNQVVIDKSVAADELGDLSYPNATLVSAVRTRMSNPQYEQTEFVLQTSDESDVVEAWYRKHRSATAQGVSVHVHAIPTGSRIVVLRYQ